jgi:hypothetical protein
MECRCWRGTIVLALDGTAVDSAIATQAAKKLDLEMGWHRY